MHTAQRLVPLARRALVERVELRPPLADTVAVLLLQAVPESRHHALAVRAVLRLRPTCIQSDLRQCHCLQAGNHSEAIDHSIRRTGHIETRTISRVIQAI